MVPIPVLARNDVRQYDDLAEKWWDPRGPLAMLQWVAEARARLIPSASRAGAVLVDVGCGGGLLTPHVADKGYVHVGVDLNATAVEQASNHGVKAVRGDALRLPFADQTADVVSAGEILEHVSDVERAVSECCRVLRPGGLFVLDTLADTALARFIGITIAERLPGGPPPGIHDPDMFVNRKALINYCLSNGVQLQLRGLRPAIGPTLGWLLGRRPTARMVPTWTTAVLFQGWGIKAQ